MARHSSIGLAPCSPWHSGSK